MARASKIDALPRFEAGSRAQWRRWLETHHRASAGVWLVTHKKGAGKPRVETADAVEECLCFGWIDSLPRKLDAERTMLLCTPRKPSSAWSRLNQERVARLTRLGAMSERGLEVVAAAKACGAWNALDEVEALLLPEDLSLALVPLEGAREHFEAFPRSVKRGILDWIRQAKRPRTRAARISETAELAAKNKRAHQWSARSKGR